METIRNTLCISACYGAMRWRGSFRVTVIRSDFLLSMFRQTVMRTRVQHTLSTLHGMVLAVGGAWKNGAGKNHLLLSVPRKKRAWFCGLWANASGPPCCET